MRKGKFFHIEMACKNDIYEANSIEVEMQIAETAKQPIEATSPIIYTERNKGVEPQYDIRADRWEIAQNAMDVVAKSVAAKRAENLKSNDNKQATQETTTQQTTTTQTNTGGDTDVK